MSCNSCNPSLKNVFNAKQKLGKIVWQFYVTGDSFDIERGAAAPGLYLLQVFDEENVLPLQRKIIFK